MGSGTGHEGSTTERVRCAGWSGSRPLASASAIAIRCTRTSSAIGSSERLAHGGAGRAHVVGHGRVGRAEDPHERSLAGEADRSVSVFHGGICLAVRLRRLAELEGGLLRDPDGPAVAEEHDVLEPGRLGFERLGQGAFAVGRPPARDPGRGAPGTAPAPTWRTASARPERSSAKSRAIVVSASDATGEEASAVTTVRGTSPRRLEELDDLGGRAAPADRHDAGRTSDSLGNSEAGKASVSPSRSPRGAPRTPGRRRGRCRTRRPRRGGQARELRRGAGAASWAARFQHAGWLSTSCAIALIPGAN